MATVMPPPPPAPSAQPLPWEEPGYPRLEALYETARLVLLQPRQAFSRMSQEVSLGRPVVFAVIFGWVGAVAAQLYQLVFRSTLAALFPPLFAKKDLVFSHAFSFLVTLTAPIWVLIGLGIVSLVLHLFLLLFGAANRGLETTFRVLAYTEATQIFQVIPVVGGLIGALWWLFIAIPGLAAAHRSSTGRAAAAVLTPMALCCVCLVALVVLLGAGLVAALRG